MAGRPKTPIVPRVLNNAETAAYLNRSTTWLSERMPELVEKGFPPKLPFVDGWDKNAVDAWLDRIGGNIDETDPAQYDKAWTAAAHE